MHEIRGKSPLQNLVDQDVEGLVDGWVVDDQWLLDFIYG